MYCLNLSSQQNSSINTSVLSHQLFILFLANIIWLKKEKCPSQTKIAPELHINDPVKSKQVISKSSFVKHLWNTGFTVFSPLFTIALFFERFSFIIFLSLGNYDSTFLPGPFSVLKDWFSSLILCIRLKFSGQYITKFYCYYCFLCWVFESLSILSGF